MVSSLGLHTHTRLVAHHTNNIPVPDAVVVDVLHGIH
jgi:hypothetical protein